MDWQPIETAPKDGTEVDLWVRSSDDPRRGNQRMTGYIWCGTHKCWRKAEDTHFVNRIADIYEITEFCLVMPPDSAVRALKLMARYSRITGRAYGHHLARSLSRFPTAGH